MTFRLQQHLDKAAAYGEDMGDNSCKESVLVENMRKLVRDFLELV